MHKGKTCGVCGNNDDETDHEFEGPGKCIFEKSEDFVAAYSMAGEHCETKPRAQGKVRCPQRDTRRQHDEQKMIRIKQTTQVRTNELGQTTVVDRNVEIPAGRATGQVQQRHSRQSGESRQESAERLQQRNPCQKLRTEYVVEGDMVCFTTKPMIACQSGCKAAGQNEKIVDFHCLPKASPFTQQLQQEADHAILKQLANKRVDFRRTLHVPVRCEA